MQIAKKTNIVYNPIFCQVFADFPALKATFTQKLLYDDN